LAKTLPPPVETSDFALLLAAGVKHSAVGMGQKYLMRYTQQQRTLAAAIETGQICADNVGFDVGF
jgi:hypothetical protein